MKVLSDTVERRLADVGLLSIRVMLGGVFMFHGAQKLFAWFGGPGIDGFAGFLESQGVPLPTLNAYMAGGTEFFGGLLILLGVMTRLAGIPVAFTMFVAAFMVHGSAFSAQNNGMEYPLTLAVVTTGIVLTGPGRLSLCHAFERLCVKQSPVSTDP